MNEDISKEKRGAIVSPDPNKVRTKIRLDGRIFNHFRELVNKSVG